RYRPPAQRARRRAGVARLRRAEEPRGVARLPRLDPVARRRRAGDAGVGGGDQSRDGSPGGRDWLRRLPRPARELAPRALDPDDRLVPRRPAPPLRSPRRPVGRPLCARERVGRRRGRTAARRAAAFRISRSLRSPRDDRSLHHRGRARDARARPSRRAAAARRPPAACVPAQLPRARRHPRRRARAGDLGDELVLRVPQVREAVGTSAPQIVFSLHIDTARTWRGGQNQVLLTVNGLRAIGHRAALVAHPGGELRRRAAEGLELIPLAPRTEMDLSAAWKLARLLKTLSPDVIHAHDPHGVAMASLALSLGAGAAAAAAGGARTPVLVASRRVDFHLK